MFTMIIVLAFMNVNISAHDFWLVPDKFKASVGESLTVFANTGMDFPNSLNAVTPDRVDQFLLVMDTERKDLAHYEVQGNSLITKISLEKPGTYVLGVSLKPKEISLTAEEFNEYLLHDGLPNIYELRKKEGILDKDAVEHYSKYPKTIVQVGNKIDQVPTKPLNLPLEIVPAENPYNLKKGDDLKVKVLFKGNPLSEIELAWSFPGQGESFAGTTKTNSKGEATVPLTKIGPYVIRLTHMEWVKKQTHEWESYWASLTFEVQTD
jgi:uncharacterized GH25 family protein